MSWFHLPAEKFHTLQLFIESQNDGDWQSFPIGSHISDESVISIFQQHSTKHNIISSLLHSASSIKYTQRCGKWKVKNVLLSFNFIYFSYFDGSNILIAFVIVNLINCINFVILNDTIDKKSNLALCFLSRRRSTRWINNESCLCGRALHSSRTHLSHLQNVISWRSLYTSH
jgi:hypothetical protein